jgi:hypothetical protein
MSKSMKAVLTKLETLLGAKIHEEEIKAQQEVFELYMEELEGVAGGMVITMQY